MEDVEDVEERRVLPHPATDLGGIIEVEPLLERAEAGLAFLVEADHLAVDDRAAAQVLRRGAGADRHDPRPLEGDVAIGVLAAGRVAGRDMAALDDGRGGHGLRT